MQMFKYPHNCITDHQCEVDTQMHNYNAVPLLLPA